MVVSTLAVKGSIVPPSFLYSPQIRADHAVCMSCVPGLGPIDLACAA